MPEEVTPATEPEMISYYIETVEGMFRINVPNTWTANVETRGNSNVVSFTDEKGSDRQFFTNVLIIRDSSTQTQELVASEAQPENGVVTNYEWTDREISAPISRYTLEAIQLSSRRRRRVQLSTEDSFIDDGLGEEPY